MYVADIRRERKTCFIKAMCCNSMVLVSFFEYQTSTVFKHFVSVCMMLRYIVTTYITMSASYIKRTKLFFGYSKFYSVTCVLNKL